MQHVRLLMFFVASSMSAVAQTPDKPRGDMFLGYSYTSADVGSRDKFNFHGVALSGDRNLKPWLAIAWKQTSYWGTAAIPFCLSSSSSSCVVVGPHDTAHLNTILGGLRIAASRDRFTPFARALFGVSFLWGCPQLGCESKAGYSQDFAGGVQVRITERHFGWRFEGSLLQTHLFGAWQNDFRISTGPVLFFYGRK